MLNSLPSQRAFLLGTCAWCLKRLVEGEPVHQVGVGLRGVDLKGRAGQVVMLNLKRQNRNIPAVVLWEDMKAKQPGFDLTLRTCSAACATALQQALEEEL